MDVQPAQHVALAGNLQIVHHRVVAVAWRLDRVGPDRGRVRAGRENAEPVLRGDPRHTLSQEFQFGGRR